MMSEVVCDSRKVIFIPGFEPQTSLFAMRSTIRCAVCCSCVTLLASPDSVGGGLGRAPRAGGACVFVFLLKICWFLARPPGLLITSLLVQITVGGIKRVGCDISWLLSRTSVLMPPNLSRCVTAAQT